jgi:hypothetical protein
MHVLAAVAALTVMMGAMAGCADDPAGDAARPSAGVPGADLGAPSAPSDPAAIERAVEATRAVDSARVELQTVYRGLHRLGDVPPGVDDVRLVQRAAFDRRSGQAQAEADMSELAAALEGADADVPGDYSHPTRVVLDGGTVYTQIGPMARSIGLEPTTWVERDVASLAGQPIDNETMALLVEPLGMLDLLRLPIGDVRVVGTEEVRGAPATRVTATVDLTAGGAGGAGEPAGAEPADLGDPSIEARFRSLGLSELPVDLWVGDDRLVRRLAFSIGGPEAGQAAGGALTTTLDVYDVGEPIDVAVPQGADVIDQAELRARVGAG